MYSAFLNNQYYLMNKDEIVATIECSRDQNNLPSFSLKQADTDRLPFGFVNADFWIENRRAPKHRKHIKELLATCGCNDLEGFIRFTYCASLNDTFWIKPADSMVQWKDISLFENEFDETIAKLAFDGGLMGEQFSSPTPEFGTDGSFAKCWKRYGNDICLLKQGSEGAVNAGKEPYSELYTYELSRQICTNSLEYDVVKLHGKIASRCKLFCTENIGYTPIVYILGEKANFQSCLNYYSSIGCEQKFKEMIVLDALTLNTDRHLKNFGVMFNTDTLQVTGMAPVFDNNLALLPYAMQDDLLNPQKYLPTRFSAFEKGFNELAISCMTPEIKNKLINLQGFAFSRNEKYHLEEERLFALESIVNLQIRNILQQKVISFHVKEENISFDTMFLTVMKESVNEKDRKILENEAFYIPPFEICDNEGNSMKFSENEFSVVSYGNIIEVEIYNAKADGQLQNLSVAKIGNITFISIQDNKPISFCLKSAQIQLKKGEKTEISLFNYPYTEEMEQNNHTVYFSEEDTADDNEEPEL